jgi:NAD+ kinase
MVAEMLEFIEDFGTAAWVSNCWDEKAVAAKIEQTDLLIALGGDGSILRAARMAVEHNTLILGVNLGRLGFLTEVEPAEWEERFKQLLTGSYRIEERLMVQARCQRTEDPSVCYHALNEVAISRGGLARVVRLATFVNNSYLTTYTADGLILSTPTGSTAYALAAGGPILPPELKNILLIPVAPHLSLERALVLSTGDVVKLVVNTDHTAILTIDGQCEVELTDGDIVEVSASPQVSRFLRLQEQNYYYQTLMQRLGWPYG